MSELCVLFEYAADGRTETDRRGDCPMRDRNEQEAAAVLHAGRANFS